MEMVKDPPPPAGVGGVRAGGLGFVMTALLLVAQMAGGGFLSLPKAVANAGWLGIAMMLVFCAGVGFSGTRLGKCWVILEERWPHLYAGGSRQPYMDIAAQALGKPGRLISMFCVLVSVFGATTVFLILMASFVADLVPALSVCEWLLVVTVFVVPFTWLGTPKDFWQASVTAAASTGITCLIIFVELLIEMPDYPDPYYRNPTLYSFSLGFGSILFAFGGASVFPTIQNDMADRSLFGRSVVLAFIGLLFMYLPVAVTAYVGIGFDLKSNILLNMQTDKAVIKVAIVLEILNLMGTYLIACNTVFQACEETLNIEKGFGWRRCAVRSSIVLLQMVIGLAIPSFDKILNLIGGSTVTVCTFLLPGIAYLKLADMKGDWAPISVPLWERTLVICIVIVGVVGGVVSTVTAFMDIFQADSLGISCFVNFNSEDE